VKSTIFMYPERFFRLDICYNIQHQNQPHNLAGLNGKISNLLSKGKYIYDLISSFVEHDYHIEIICENV
jgi:hypothetical protein